MTPRKQERLRELWISGVKAESITAELGVCYATLRKWRVRMGLPPREYHLRHAHRRPLAVYPTLVSWKLPRALRLWYDGYSTADIAEQLNCPEAHVANSLSRWRERVRLSDIVSQRGRS